MATGSLQVNRDIILATRRQYLAERKHITPMDAIMALAAMQNRPPYILNTATDGERVTVIGEIRLTETYDPVLAALRYVRAGADAVSFYTDHTIYTRDLDDLLMVSRGVKKIPVIFQNYIFDEYGVISARASGAAALFGYSAVLAPPVLRRVISMTQRYKMTSILQINSMAHVETIYELSPHVVSIGDPESANVDAALNMLKEFKDHIPYYCRIMISNTLHSIEEVEMAVEAGVHAVIVGDSVYSSPAKIEKMRSLVMRGEVPEDQYHDE